MKTELIIPAGLAVLAPGRPRVGGRSHTAPILSSRNVFESEFSSIKHFIACWGEIDDSWVSGDPAVRDCLRLSDRLMWGQASLWDGQHGGIRVI